MMKLANKNRNYIAILHLHGKHGNAVMILYDRTCNMPERSCFAEKERQSMERLPPTQDGKLEVH